MKRLILALLLLAGTLSATTTITGNAKDLGGTVINSQLFARFYLRGCGGNIPRVSGTAIIPPTAGAVYYYDAKPDSNGQFSGTLYSTRASDGVAGGDIECGGSTTAAWYGMQIWYQGKASAEVPVHAKSGGSIDVTSVTPITTNPVTTAPTGDSTYLRLDAGNSPVTGSLRFTGATPITVSGDNPVVLGGSLSAKRIENCRWVDGSSTWAGADFGAKVNAALADAGARGSVCIAPGSYTYSTDIVMPAPGSLLCPALHTCVLNYTGSGNAIKVGPDGLIVSTHSDDDYVVEGLLFTGGSSMTEGIFVNEFVTKFHILFNEFRDFGNSSAWDIWEQGQNWEARIFDNYIFNNSHGCNGIYMNAADPANGTNGDFGQSQGSFSGNHIQGCTTAVYVNGFNTKVTDNTLVGSPIIIVGAYGNAAKIENNDMEANGNNPCIQFGDASGPRTGSFIDSINATGNLCNAHNSSFGTTAHFMGPTIASSAIENTLLIGNNVADLTAGQPLVVQNNLASQNNNNAYENKSNTCNCNQFSNLNLPSRLHTSGGSIASWGGTDGDVFYANGQALINGRITTLDSSGSPLSIQSKTDAQANFNFACGLTAQQDCAINFQDHTLTTKGGLFLANGTHGGRLSGINNNNQGWQVGSDGRFYVKRIQAELGTVYSGADAAIVLSAGWGSTAAVSAAQGYDPSATFTVTASGTGQAANPTITITFKDGTWSNTPGCVMFQTGGSGAPAFVFTTTPSVTAPIFTFQGTPTAASTYTFTMSCMGR